MARELSDTRARLDAMLQQLREELAQLTQLTGELQKAPNAFKDWGDDDARRRLN
jgi:prefoldin subunit 5